MEELAYKTKGVCIPMLFSQLGAFGLPRGGSWGTGKFTLGYRPKGWGRAKKRLHLQFYVKEKKKQEQGNFFVLVLDLPKGSYIRLQYSSNEQTNERVWLF